MQATALIALLLMQASDPAVEGWKALEAKRYEEAVEHFRKAVEADPKDYAAQFHFALALSLAGRDVEAVARYKTVLELKPGLYEAELNLGILLLRRNEVAEAIPYLEAAVQQKPGEFRPLYYLAEGLSARGEHQRAEELYERALGADPKSAAARLGLARARARQGRLAEAAPEFQRAAELDSAYKDALLELAALYETRGETAEAMRLYAQFPENAAARERLGELLIEAGRPVEAIPHLEWAVAHSPTAANRLALAAAYLRSKKPEQALPLLERALGEAPENTQVRMMYARVLRDSKQYRAAAREFARVIEARPDLVEAWKELAGMLILLEEYPQALAALDRLRALGAETAAHYYFRGMIFDKTQQIRSAIEAYEKFLAMSGGSNPDEEFVARQRVRILKRELDRR